MARSATFMAGNTLHGLPKVTGFLDTPRMATGFLIVAAFAGPQISLAGAVR